MRFELGITGRRHRATYLEAATAGVRAHLVVVFCPRVDAVDNDEVEEAVVNSLLEDLLQRGTVRFLQIGVILVLHHLETLSVSVSVSVSV